MTSTLLQQAVEALARARTFVLNGVSLAEPADETLSVIEAAIASLESALQQQPAFNRALGVPEAVMTPAMQLTLVDAAKALQHAAQHATPDVAVVYKARAAEVFEVVSAVANGVNAPGEGQR